MSASNAPTQKHIFVILTLFVLLKTLKNSLQNSLITKDQVAAFSRFTCFLSADGVCPFDVEI